jgi:carbon-monoxide dehydrogenase large subunit
VIVDATLTVPRIAAMPIEPRGVLVQPEPPDGRLTVWTSTQVPFAVRAAIARRLGMAEEHVRVIAPDVGAASAQGPRLPRGRSAGRGGAPAAAAREVDRDRREHFLATAPDRISAIARGSASRATARSPPSRQQFTRDGGAYPVIGDVISLNTINHLPGPYRVRT